MSLHLVVPMLISAFLAAAPVAAHVVTADQLTGHARDAVEFPKQEMTVWFFKPVKVGDRILFGKYIIEHDDVRMSRGRPCTYLYAASDPRLPVVSFSCKHLKRSKAAAPTVWVRSFHQANGMIELLAFQFAGETMAHGVPDTE